MGSRQDYTKAPSETLLRRGKIKREDWTLVRGGEMGGATLFLSPKALEAVEEGLACGYDQGMLSALGEWLWADLSILDSTSHESYGRYVSRVGGKHKLYGSWLRDTLARLWKSVGTNLPQKV